MKISIYIFLIMFSTVFGVADTIKITTIDYKSSKVQYHVIYNITEKEINGEYSVVLLDADNEDMVIKGTYIIELSTLSDPELKLNGTHRKTSDGVSLSVFFAEDNDDNFLVFVYGKNPNSASILNEFKKKNSMYCPLSSIIKKFENLKGFEIIIVK